MVINPKLIVAIVVLAGSNLFTATVVHKIESAKLNKFKLEVAEETFKLKEFYDNEARKLQETVDVLFDTKNKQIETITRKYNNALISLRNRPTRDQIIAQNPSNPQSGTGAGLSREDGEFLAGEAARANKIREELAYCYKQYDEVREKFNSLNEEK